MIVLRHDPRWRRGPACRTVLSSDREGACVALLTDRFPATVDREAIRLGIDCPDVSVLNRWPLFVKRLTAPLRWIARALPAVIPSGGHRGSAPHRSDRALSARTLRFCSGRPRVCACQFMRSRWRPIAASIQPALRRRGWRVPAGTTRQRVAIRQVA